ncbi:MAG: hypothetical protein QOC87_2246 [Actinomycetota bacterium]|jgi:hypothetical protein|nr:hypothetical protein [Actinomycetota bacterium]
MSHREASYVLPLYATQPRRTERFIDYLGYLSKTLEVIVVDNSPDDVFQAHASSWGRDISHLRPDPRFDFAYRKVTNVTTGVVAATFDKVIVADDDVVYGDVQIDDLLRRLDSADLVIPQNYFEPLPWHARWDSARSLLNRAVWIDFPGTLGLRRSRFVTMGGYDGDLLFENLELIRTVTASGGRVEEAVDLFVSRLPPDARHFWSQRVRQAYDDFALPARMALWLSLAPLAAVSAARRRRGLLVLAAAAAVAVAEKGRRRAGANAYFPPSVSLFAPLWLGERAITAWLALGARFFLGGVPYAGAVLSRSATPMAELRSRFEEGRPAL